MARAKRQESLALNLALLIFLVLTVSLAVVSAAALGGVFDLANRQATARQVAYQQALTAELRARLDGAIGVAERAGAILSDAVGPELNRKALAMQLDAGLEFVDRLIVATPEGAVLSAYPAFQAPRNVSGTQYLAAAIDKNPRFVYVPGKPSALWIAQKVDTVGGQLVLLLRVRTAFLEVLAEKFSSADEGRVAIVMDSEATMVAENPSGPRVDVKTLDFQATGQSGLGSVSALSMDAVVLQGQYSNVTEYPGIRWNVVVLEPRGRIVDATWRALAPATVVLVLSGGLSVLISFVFMRRQVAPIRDLELRAREATTGAYVSPIELNRTDELGRMADAFNAMALRLNSLHDLTQLLASSSNLDRVLDGILTAMGHIVGTNRIAVFLLDEDGESMVLVRSQGLNVSNDIVVPVSDSGWLSAAMEADGPISFTGGAGWRKGKPASSETIEGIPFAIGMAIPLAVGQEPLGVVMVMEPYRREFTEAEVEIVRTFSAQASLAVYNSRLFEFESESRREAEALREIAERLATPKDLEHSFAAVMDIACDLFDVPEAHIAFVDREMYGLPPAANPSLDRMLLEAWEWTWKEYDGNCFVHLTRGVNEAVDRLLVDIGVDEALLLTVTRAGKPGAVVVLSLDRAEYRIGSRIRRRAAALCNELALALDNAFYYAQARARSANLETIFRISQAVSSSLQIRVVLNRVLDVVQKIFTADAVSLMEYDETRQSVVTVMARGLISSEMLHYECIPGEDVAGQVFSGGAPVKIDDLVNANEGLLFAAREKGLRSLMSVPLLARGKSLGVLTVFSLRAGAFSDEDMDLLHTFALQAALAIDTANLYGKEHHVASVLQESILPQSLPQYPEIEAASVYLAAGQEAEIGGDYFDLFKAPDGSVVLAIGDVCGKGVEAATKTSMIKFSVRALVAAGLGPDRVLSEVNRMIAESGQPSDIVTLWVGMINTETGFLCYANGGHPPALLWRSGSGTSERLDPTGPLLGALSSAVFEEASVVLQHGDILLLYTDGVTEARRGNKFFGEGRLRRVLAKASTAEEVAGGLLNALDTFVPGNLRDDAAVLVVRLRELESAVSAYRA